jgi:putative Ca2+/H+ antiporter (TMEM165/GDT1 family)
MVRANGGRARSPRVMHNGDPMDWKLLFTTFGAIFVAELGDKTQLATLSLAAGGHSRWLIFLGAACALVATSALGVLGGEVVSKFISPIWIRRIAGLVFVVMGLQFLFRKA